jgi:hypothetical protein
MRQVSEGSFRKIKKRSVQLYVLRVPLLSLSRETMHTHHTFLSSISLTLDTVFPIFSQRRTSSGLPTSCPRHTSCLLRRPGHDLQAEPPPVQGGRDSCLARPHRPPTPRIESDVEGKSSGRGGPGVGGET